MARKKQYKDGELEKEFNKALFNHMYITIRSSLIAFSEADIVNSELVTTLFGKLKGSYVKKMEQICNAIIDLHDNGHDSDIIPLYEYCWNLLSPNLTDNYIYSRS